MLGQFLRETYWGSAYHDVSKAGSLFTWSKGEVSQHSDTISERSHSQRHRSRGSYWAPTQPVFQDPVIRVLPPHLLVLSDCEELDLLDSLTGNTELDVPLHSHTNYREGHQTGDVGDMVLGPGQEDQH